MLKLSRMSNGQPEIFTSIQGEGVSAGTPSVFVRLAHCSLRCTWCDTKYTWDWNHYDLALQTMDLGIDEIVARVERGAARTVVVTGGEPMLQTKGLAQLLPELHQRGFRIEVETSGTILPLPDISGGVAQWNVSPKLTNSGNDLKTREVPAALRWFAESPAAYFKFVVIDPDDLREVCDLVERYRIPRSHVLLMPEGTDAETLTRRSSWLVDRCTEYGFRFTTRLHILLWGDQRGR